MVRLRLRIDRMASPEGGTYEVMWISSSGQLSDRTEVTLSDRAGGCESPLFAPTGAGGRAKTKMALRRPWRVPFAAFARHKLLVQGRGYPENGMRRRG